MDSKKHKFYLEKLKSITYIKQDHWDIFKEIFFNKISNFSEFKNFRINGLSNMLETGLPSEDLEETLKGKNYSIEYNSFEKKEVEKRFKQLYEMMGEEIFLIPFNKLIGNPRNHKFIFKSKNFFLNFDDLYHVYSAWQIKRICKLLQKDPSTILEIGAGYGNLASKLKTIFINSKYIIIDLPEVLLIQNYYLNIFDSNMKIINLIDNSKTNIQDLYNQNFDIALIPFNEFKNLKNIPFELAINTRSFGEMPKEVLGEYIQWIEDNICVDGLLYNTNRYVFTKSKDKNKIRDYPYDNFWEPIISQPQWLQTHLHEFLLLRKREEEKIPLKVKLNSFPIETPPPGPIMEDIQTQKDWLKAQGIYKK